MSNPIIGRRHLPGVQGIYNSAVAPFGDGFVGTFRLEKQDRFPRLHLGWSDDGLQWQIEPDPITFANQVINPSDYAYDPRVCRIDDDFLSIGAAATTGPRSAWQVHVIFS